MAGAALGVAASAALIYCGARYGNRSTLPRGVVVALIAAALVQLVGAVMLSRALARGRVSFVLGVPLFYVWPVLLAGLAVVWLLTLSWGDTLFVASSAGTSGKRRETRRGRRRRARQSGLRG